MVYKLSATLTAHSSDVRAVAGPSPSLVLSASRDATAMAWTRSPSSNAFAPSQTFSSGSRYINSLTYIPPTADAPAGYAVTGGQDTVINVFSLDPQAKPEPVYALIGHTENVCTLDARPDGTIISGSWDKTARVWVGFQPALELKGHEHAVWAVLAIEDDQYLTGSADKTIKLWKHGKVSSTFPGHTDVVRGLARLPDIGFASCANDSEIIIWTLSGDVVYKLSGHTSFVYSLATLPSGDLVSSGEDRSARIWKGTEVVQTIVHPAISVWSVASMPNGDIVTGSSDGVVRIFSESPDRWASEGDLKSYDEEVARQTLPSQQVGDVKKSDLPGLEALGQQGRRDGQNLMILNGENVEAYQWSMATASWQKIGDVVDAPGPGRRQIYDGREYDYVFDVDIQEGVPPLKLPYNVSENPYLAAQRFLQNNDLPLTYLDEVVRFIEKNTAGVTLGASSNDFVDPYTGRSAYRAGSAPSTTFTQGGGNPDPFTGASSRRPPAATAKPKLLPVKAPLSFKQANLTAMRTKIHQLNDAAVADPALMSQVLAPEEVATLDTIFTFLTDASTDASFDPAVQQQLDNLEIELLVSILDRWDESRRFPVLDLARLVAAFSPGAFAGDGESLHFARALLVAADVQAGWASVPLPKTRDTNTLLALRTLANVAQFANSDASAQWVAPVFAELKKVPYAALGKQHRIALATIVLNISVMAVKGRKQLVGAEVLEVLNQVLLGEDSEPEAAYRGLISLGNLAFVVAPGSQAVLKSLLAPALVLSAKFKEPRFRDIESELRLQAK